MLYKIFNWIKIKILGFSCFHLAKQMQRITPQSSNCDRSFKFTIFPEIKNKNLDSFSFGIFLPLLFETSLFPRGAHRFFPSLSSPRIFFSFPLLFLRCQVEGKKSRAGAISLATTTVSEVNSRSGGPSWKGCHPTVTDREVFRMFLQYFFETCLVSMYIKVFCGDLRF